MKEKVIFILTIIGSFSATILIFLTEILSFVGLDTSGYVDILKMISMGLAGVILIVGMVFLNKYNTKQQIANTEQKTTIQSILSSNTEFMQNALPKIASDLLATAQAQATDFLVTVKTQANELTKMFKDEMNTAMTEMLPDLAKQTMDIVTKESQDIIAKTTSKADDTMMQMADLWPTYAKNISDQVAQTVRENNAHYHKMLTEIKATVAKLQLINSNSAAPAVIDIDKIVSNITEFENSLATNLDNAFDLMEQRFELLATKVDELLIRPTLPIIEPIPNYIPAEPTLDIEITPAELMPDIEIIPAELMSDIEITPTSSSQSLQQESSTSEPEPSATQNDDISEESDETELL